MSAPDTPMVPAPARSRAVLFAALAVGAVMVLLVVLLITRDPAGDRSAASPVEGKPAPALNGKPVIGEAFDIGTNERWLLVNFFATWCVPCIEEHPELRKLSVDGAADGSLEVVSVAYGVDEADEVRKFFVENGGDWTVLDADQGQTALDWGVSKIPESFLVAPSGLVVKRFQGGVRAADVQALVAAYEEQAS